MSDRDFVIDACSELEAVLTRAFGATGTGLVSKAKSLGSRMPASILNGVSELGRTRNGLAHKRGASMSASDRQRFEQLSGSIKQELAALKELLRLPGGEFRILNKLYGMPLDCWKPDNDPWQVHCWREWHGRGNQR